MADNITFKVGALSSLSNAAKKTGQLLFAYDNTSGSIYYDKNSSTRIKFNLDANKLLTTAITSLTEADTFLENNVVKVARAAAAATAIGNDGILISSGYGSNGWGNQLWLNDSADGPRLMFRSKSSTTTWDNWSEIYTSSSISTDKTWRGWTADLSDTTVYNENTWYPVVGQAIPITGIHHLKCAVQLNSGSVPSWCNHTSGFTCNLEVLAIAGGWGTTYADTILLNNTYRHVSDNKYPVTWYQMTNSSRPVFYCRGGGKYIFYTDYPCVWTIKNVAFTESNLTVEPVTEQPSIDRYGKGKISANLNGIADYASSLTGSRKINGTIFDNTRDITTENWGFPRTITIGNVGKSVNGSSNYTWTHAEIGATVSNTWTNGAAAGPKLTTTVNGVTGEPATIPSASTSISGIVTIENQSFKGMKTFYGAVRGYMYNLNHNAPAFILDKPGSYWAGIGANNSDSTIYFGPCVASETTAGGWDWVSDYNQIWSFKGDIRSSRDIYVGNNLYFPDTSWYLEGSTGHIKANHLGLGGYGPNVNYQINLVPNKAAMSFRSSLAEYDTYIYYGTSGNEALTFATTNTVTHIQFANGHALSNFSSSYWNTIAPAMDIANNNVHIGGIAGTDYKFKVTGTSYFSDAMTAAGLFTYAGMQTGTADAARCVWFSDSAVVGRPVYDTTFTYNPVSKEIGTIKRISHPAGATLHLGNADNENWVATQDIRSHSGADYWVISAAGSAWFKKLNLGYTYGNGGSYLLNVIGNTMLAGTVYLDTAASTYISSTYYTGTSARSNILTNNPFTADNIDNVTDNGLHFGTIGSYAGPGFQANDGLILSMSWNTGNAYGAQLGFDDVTTANMYVRNKNSSWSSWEKVLLSNNYTDYTVKKDGTGASGTWGINVTGYSKSLLYPSQLTTDALIDAFNAANTFQVTTWNSTSTPGVSNGILISTGWASTSYGAQIAIDDDPTYYIALRQRNGDGWKAWKRIPMGDGTGASGTWGISVTGSSGSCTGNAATATLATTVGTSDMKLYAHHSNEVNFGGTNESSTIYFGYRALDSKPIPTQFIFGGSSGTADLRVKNVYLGSGTSSYITASSYTGNAATATKATQDANGNNIASTYLRKDLGFQVYTTSFVPSYTTAGWYRVAYIVGLKGYFAGFVTVGGGYHYGEPSTAIFVISGMHNQPTITQIGGTAGLVASEVRLTGGSGQYYLEIYCGTAGGDISTQYVTIFGCLNASTTYSPTSPNGSLGTYTAYAKLEDRANWNYGATAYGNPQVGDIWLMPV